MQLAQVNMLVVKYVAKFTQLSYFDPSLISIEWHRAFDFQDGLNPFLKDKLSLSIS